MARSGIEWTESTWNPLTGCTKISPGCKHCYAERMAKRLQAMGQPNYVNGFKLSMHEHVLEKPLEWKTPQVIFVNSMSDLFHKDVPLEFIQRVFDVMKRALAPVPGVDQALGTAGGTQSAFGVGGEYLDGRQCRE
jgi:protein gp37